MERQFVKDFDERNFLHSCIIVWLVEINNVTIKGCHYYKISIMIMVLPTKLTHCLYAQVSTIIGMIHATDDDGDNITYSLANVTSGI
jgi:hypothetical protein